MITDDRNSFITDNSFEIATRRFQISIKLGPSPKQQVINQMIKDGDIEIDEGTIEAKELPVIYPSLQK